MGTYAPGLKSIEDAIEIRQRILLSLEMAERSRTRCAQGLLTFVDRGRRSDRGRTGRRDRGNIAPGDRQRFSPHQSARGAHHATGGGAPDPSDLRREIGGEGRGGARRRGIDYTSRRRKISGTISIGSDQSEIHAHTIIWAAGVAASPLAKTMGVELDRGGRVKVRSDLTIEGHPEVFVIGDLAACVDAEGRTMPGLAPVAIQQGRWAAETS